MAGSWTKIYVSQDPLNFGSVPLEHSGAKRASLSHPMRRKIVRDTDGKWYMTQAGWGRGGLNMTELKWNDGQSDDDTSMPHTESCSASGGEE